MFTLSVKKVVRMKMDTVQDGGEVHFTIFEYNEGDEMDLTPDSGKGVSYLLLTKNGEMYMQRHVLKDLVEQDYVDGTFVSTLIDGRQYHRVTMRLMNVIMSYSLSNSRLAGNITRWKKVLDYIKPCATEWA